MVRSAFIFATLILATTMLGAGVARADGVDIVAEYNVSGLLTITGSNACPPAPACAETLSFSLLMGSVLAPASYGLTYAAYVVPDSWTVEPLGPLGQFSSIGEPVALFPGGGICGAEGDCNYIPIYDQLGDEIDLHLAAGVSDTPIVPDIVAADLFVCGASICGTPAVMFNFGEVETTVTPIVTPEPSSLVLLAAGLLALTLVAVCKNRAINLFTTDIGDAVDTLRALKTRNLLILQAALTFPAYRLIR